MTERRSRASPPAALEVPPGGIARSIGVSGARVGVELDGTAARSAWPIDSQVDVGYPPTPNDIGVDVPGHGFIARSFVSADTAVRASGAGFAEIRASNLSANTAFSGACEIDGDAGHNVHPELVRSDVAPGRYRLVAKAPIIRPVRAGFTVFPWRAEYRS